MQLFQSGITFLAQKHKIQICFSDYADNHIYFASGIKGQLNLVGNNFESKSNTEIKDNHYYDAITTTTGAISLNLRQFKKKTSTTFYLSRKKSIQEIP